MNKTKTVAQLLVECLMSQNVEYVFGIPGAKIDAVFNALLDSPIKMIVCRHEQNAAFMAAAYGRLTGKAGVVLVTSGPGVANLATGLLTATTEGDPIIAIGGAVSRNMRLKQSHQSTDNLRLMEAVTKAQMEITVGETLPEIITNAFRIATSPQAGAVFISVPQDVSLEESTLSPISPLPALSQGGAPLATIRKVADILNQARHPVILLGMEASRPQNTQAIRQLLAQTPMAVVSTYQAAGVVSRKLLPCFGGRVGLFHNQPGDRLLDNADCVLTIGYNPVEYDPEIWNAGKNRPLIHLNYQVANIHITYSPTTELIGDITLTLEQLTTLLTAQPKIKQNPLLDEARAELQTLIKKGSSYHGSIMHPLQFIHHLHEIMDDQTIVISDIGSHYMWIARYLYSYQPHQLLFSNGQQTLGVALPWAIAAKLSHPNKKVISVSGDGGFLFSATELETAVREKLPLVHCVWCDGAYNMVMEQQLMKYKRASAIHFGAIDLVKFAESFGAYGFQLKDPNEFPSLLAHALTLDKPVIIGIPIDYRDNPSLFASANTRQLT